MNHDNYSYSYTYSYFSVVVVVVVTRDIIIPSKMSDGGLCLASLFEPR
jgi:hypothetical protein